MRRALLLLIVPGLALLAACGGSGGSAEDGYADGYADGLEQACAHPETADVAIVEETDPYRQGYGQGYRAAQLLVTGYRLAARSQSERGTPPPDPCARPRGGDARAPAL